MERMNGWREWKDGWIDGWKEWKEWMDGWIEGWKEWKEWLGGWMDGWKEWKEWVGGAMDAWMERMDDQMENSRKSVTWSAVPDALMLVYVGMT